LVYFFFVFIIENARSKKQNSIQFFFLYLSSLPSYTIPVKKKLMYTYFWSTLYVDVDAFMQRDERPLLAAANT